jgi:hypothetical protein
MGTGACLGTGRGHRARGPWDQCPEQGIDLTAQRIGAGVVPDHKIGMTSLFFAGPLSPFARVENRLGPAAMVGRPAKSLGTRRIDEDDDVTQILPAGLEQDRGVENHGPAAGL